MSCFHCPTAGLSYSLSNPSIQASLNNCQLQSSLSNPSINSSLRLSNSSPRRRPNPISPLTLSPGSEQRRGLAKQLSPTMSPSLSPITQVHTQGFACICLHKCLLTELEAHYMLEMMQIRSGKYFQATLGDIALICAK